MIMREEINGTSNITITGGTIKIYFVGEKLETPSRSNKKLNKVPIRGQYGALLSLHLVEGEVVAEELATFLSMNSVEFTRVRALHKEDSPSIVYREKQRDGTYIKHSATGVDASIGLVNKIYGISLDASAIKTKCVRVKTETTDRIRRGEV